MTQMTWFDGHLDLACLALMGRDMLVPPAEAKGPPQPAALTFPSMREGQLYQCIGTIFTGPDFPGPCGYRSGDVEGANKAGKRQLEMYQLWAQTRVLRPLSFREDLDNTDGPFPHVLLSMEGADPIRDPEDVAWWHEQGLRLVGLAWNKGTRYAGGNARPGPLTEAGHALVEALDQYGIIHDLSHLCDEAAWQLLEHSQGPVIASHSTSRTLLQSEDQRHLSDALIQAINERNGIIGLNLLSQFLRPNGMRQRATIEDAVQQLEGICQKMGRRDGVGLGSDMDGGYNANFLPQGMKEPKDLTMLCDALAQHGWSNHEIEGFVRNNWLRFLRQHLPTQNTPS